MSVSISLDDLERLEQLYAEGFHDPFLDNALRKIIEHQIARDEADLAQTNEALAQFEGQYGLTSDEFWKRFQSGLMSDAANMMEWNVLCNMRQRILSRLRILRGVGADE